MNRRKFLGTVAGTAVVGLAGCLSDTEYRIETARVQSSPRPLSVTVSVLDGDATIEGPASLAFTLSNPTERAVRVRTIGIWPFGVLSLTSASSSTNSRRPPITLYSEAYTQTDRVTVGPNRNSLSIEGDPIVRSLDPGNRIEVGYELHGDKVTSTGTYRVTGWSSQPVLSYMTGGESWNRYTPQVEVSIKKKSSLSV